MFPNIYYVEIETKIFPNLDYMHFILKSFYNPTDHSGMSEPWKLMQSVQNNSEEERGGEVIFKIVSPKKTQNGI